MSLRAGNDEGTIHVVLSGEIDVSAVPALDDAFGDAAERHGLVVVDMADVTFVDSSGVGALLRLRQRVGSRFVVGSTSPTVERVLTIAGVAAILRQRD